MKFKFKNKLPLSKIRFKLKIKMVLFYQKKLIKILKIKKDLIKNTHS